MSNFKPKDNPSRVFIPEILWKKFSSDDRKLIIEYNMKIRHLQAIPEHGKSQSISCHQGQEEGSHEPDNPPNEETSDQDQQLLAS